MTGIARVVIVGAALLGHVLGMHGGTALVGGPAARYHLTLNVVIPQQVYPVNMPVRVEVKAHHFGKHADSGKRSYFMVRSNLTRHAQVAEHVVWRE